MSVLIRLTDLRHDAECDLLLWKEGQSEEPRLSEVEYANAVLALVDAVEAAHTLHTLRTPGHVSDDCPLCAALSRFDHGGADGQPTTTNWPEAQ